MGRLRDLSEQLDAYQKGVHLQPKEPPMEGHISAIVGAIKGIQLNIQEQEGYDYTPEIQKLGEAVTKALKAHGNELIKAISGISINVEAPHVTVAAPEVSVAAPEVNVSPVVEVRQSGAVRLDIYRDKEGLMKTVIQRDLDGDFEPDDGMRIE